MDPLLRRFVGATDEAEIARALNALIEEHALPLAKAIVARKLRSYRQGRPGPVDVQDRDDVIADAMLTLVERLHAARADRDQPPIENFVNYSAAVILSACAHHIRRSHPERARLKNRLRYVFSTDQRVAAWAADDDELACGLAEWRGRSADADAERRLRDALGRASRWPSMKKSELTAATIDLLAAAAGPVHFESLVTACASAGSVVEPRETGDASLLRASDPAPDVVIDQRRFLGRVWEEVGTLPAPQRAALLLNLRDANGAGLLWLLPLAGVATIRQIARAVEVDEVEFAALWPDLPLDDAAIGVRLGCTRQQVINLRMAARKRLASRVRRGRAVAPAGRDRPANLAPGSDSLRGSA